MDVIVRVGTRKRSHVTPGPLPASVVAHVLPWDDGGDLGLLVSHHGMVSGVALVSFCRFFLCPCFAALYQVVCLGTSSTVNHLMFSSLIKCGD